MVELQRSFSSCCQAKINARFCKKNQADHAKQRPARTTLRSSRFKTPFPYANAILVAEFGKA
jgi:hypothetical protein